MKRALVLGLFLLAACKTEIKSSAFRCDKQNACSDGWFCAADGYCHDRDAGAAISCTDGGECGNGWRCGQEGVCHPLTGAGAIPCRYGNKDGDSDCTDGWRCGFANVCVDAASEKLADIPGGVGSPSGFGSPLPPGTVKGLFGVPQARANSVLIHDADAGVYWFVRRAGSKDRPEMSYLKVPQQGIGDTFAVGQNGFWFFRDGGLSWLDYDGGGPYPVKTDAGQVLGPTEVGTGRVTQLRVLPLLIEEGNVVPERGVAFNPQGTGMWTLVSGATGFATPDFGTGQQYIDVLGVPLRPPFSGNISGAQQCMVSVFKDMFGPDCACIEMGSMGGSSCTQRICSNGRSPDGGRLVLEPGDLRLGSGGLIAQVEWDFRFEGVYRVETALKVKDISSSLNDCNALPPLTGNDFFEVRCRRPCEEFENLVDFVPVRSGAELGFDVACERPGGQRVWSRLLPGAAVSNEDSCQRTELEGLGIRYTVPLYPSIVGEQRQAQVPQSRPQVPVVPTGGWARLGVPVGATGSNVVSGPDFSNSAPWILDQPPTVFIEVPQLGTIALTKDLLGMRGADGHFFANAQDSSSATAAAARIEGFPLKAVTGNRSLMDVSFTNGTPEIRIVGHLNIPAADFGSPVFGTRVRSSTGDLIMVSTRHQILIGPVIEDGGFTELEPVLVPSPGNDIVSLAEASDGGTLASVWAATRTNVFRVSQNTQGRWQAQEAHLEFPDFVRNVWVTPEGQSRIGTSSGTVYSLPSGLKLAEPPVGLKGTAQAYLQYCKQVLMIDDENLYTLNTQGAGQGSWSAPRLPAPGVLKDGRIFPGANEVWIFGRWGDYWRVPVSTCP